MIMKKDDYDMLQEVFSGGIAAGLGILDEERMELHNKQFCKTMIWEEIKEKFPEQYVGLMYPTKNENDEIISAIVVCSSKTTSYELMRELELDKKLEIVVYTGEVKDVYSLKDMEHVRF